MAALSFGSVATGGLGMAGGLWIVTGTGALVGAAGGSAAAVLMQLNVPAARRELIKLQTTIAEVTLRHGRKSDATGYVATLIDERDEVRSKLNSALQRNEDDAEAVKRLRDLEDAFGDAIRWLHDRIEAA
jgi:hypothetical protein